MRILLSGYYGHGNAGDEIVLSGIRAGIEAEAHGRPFELRALSGSPEDTLSTHGLRACRQFSPAGVLRSLAWADCLVLGGGSLIQDVTSRRSALYYLWLARIAQALGRRVFAWAQGFGPLGDPGLRRMTARVLMRAGGVTVRDSRSLEDLRALGVAGAVLSADPAYLAPQAATIGEGVLPSAGERQGYLGIAARDWPGLGPGAEALASACASFSREASLLPLYIPFQPGRDADISARMCEASGPPASAVRARLSPPEMVRLFAGLDQALGMRLHSLILAARAGVPFAGVSYDPKVREFCRMAQMPCIPVDGIEAGAVAALLADLRGRREETAAALRQFASVQERDALLSASLFWETMSR